MTRVGFSGTREGMTKAQAAAVAITLRDLGATHLHHGDCVGCDADAHLLARALGVAVELHPPSNPSLRAFCEMRPGEVVRPAVPYAHRNRIIAHDTAALIACPKEEHGEHGGGTWMTVGFGRREGMPLAIIRPSGRVERERRP